MTELAQSSASPMVRMLDPQGRLFNNVAQAPLSVVEIVNAFRLMLLSRTFDRRATSLQRQGRMGTFSAVSGQEASVVGAAMALDPDRDWIVPQYREMPALVRHGFPLNRYFLYWMGNPAGAKLDTSVRVLPIQIALAAQLPHATGLAWGLSMQGIDGVVMVYFGDGATSEGDAHEAMNLAGVVKAPVIFLLQNNGWAISTPTRKQTAAASLADRARGYGFPGITVDGNDLFAVFAVTREAVARARAGEGPTLIETLTYRMGAHNTADDPSRYMSEDLLAQWSERDPIERVRRYLLGQHLLDEAAIERLQQEIDSEIDCAIDWAESFEKPHVGQLFSEAYDDPPNRLRDQEAMLKKLRRTSS